MAGEFRPCEVCKRKLSLLYCAFPDNKQGFPYLYVCVECVSDIGKWAEDLKAMCDDEYFWNGRVVDGSDVLLWSETDGQIFNPHNKAVNQ